MYTMKFKQAIKCFFICMLAALSFSNGGYAQETDSLGVLIPAENKSIVYIARRNTEAPFLKFRIYDGDRFLGRLGVHRFFAYECDPGHHVFAAKSENTSFVEAELEAGKVYLLDVEGKKGILYARVALLPLDKNHKRYEKDKERFLKLVTKGKGELLVDADDQEAEAEGEEEDVEDGKILQRFNNLKAKGKKITQLTPDMHL